MVAFRHPAEFSPGDTYTVTVVALPGYDAMALSAVPEILRLANVHFRFDYQWTVQSVNGKPVDGAFHVPLHVESRVDVDTAGDMILFCGGRHVSGSNGVPLELVRRLAATGKPLGAFASGIFPLARAGVLDGHTIAPFRRHRTLLARQFPNVRVSPQLYAMDGQRLTCAGGTAALHLMLNWLSRRHGQAAAARVSEALLLGRLRDAEEIQPWPLADRLGTHSRPLLAAVEAMQHNLENPLDREQLAVRAGTTVRQLERLFALHLKVSPQRFYRNLRLEHARQLLRHSNLPLTEVARRCGFLSSSHFSTTYRRTYGACPMLSRRGNASASPTPARIEADTESVAVP